MKLFFIFFVCLFLNSCMEASDKPKDGFLFPVLAECEDEVKKGLQTGVQVEEYEIHYFDKLIQQAPNIKGYARFKTKYDNDPFTYTALVNTIYADCYGHFWKEIDKYEGFGEELERTIRVNENLGYNHHRVIIESDIVRIYFSKNKPK